MGYKKVNGIEVIELGESQISVSWLKSRTEAEAVQMRSDKNQTRNAWKQVHGLSVPNYVEDTKKAEKPKKPRKKKEESEG